MHRIRGRIQMTLAMALMVAGSACGGETTAAGSDGSASGDWSLRRYDNRALPVVVIQRAATTVELISGSLLLGADASYQITTSFRQTQNGVVTASTQVGRGLWVDRGGMITLVPDAGSERATASRAGNVLTLSGRAEDGSVIPFEYAR